VTDVLETLPFACPALTAVTVTVSRFLRIEDFSFNDAFVAPRITAPLSRHSYR
jgi:hypothetical protein